MKIDIVERENIAIIFINDFEYLSTCQIQRPINVFVDKIF